MNTIPEDQFKARLNILMNELNPCFDTEKNTYSIKDDWWLRELYILHNDRITPNENNKSCGSCVMRTFKKVKALWQQIDNEQ
jgi:hypothetical protein